MLTLERSMGSTSSDRFLFLEFVTENTVELKTRSAGLQEGWSPSARVYGSFNILQQP